MQSCVSFVDQTLEQSETDLPVEEEETSDVEPLDHSQEGTSSGKIAFSMEQLKMTTTYCTKTTYNNKNNLLLAMKTYNVN